MTRCDSLVLTPTLCRLLVCRVSFYSSGLDSIACRMLALQAGFGALRIQLAEHGTAMK